jgi:dihydrofolate synthase/folylpolyglutamate synthase
MTPRARPDALAYLFGLEHFGIKFGLDNIAAILEALDHPEHAFATLHVAGTNGKGSVTAMVHAALRAAGYRAARYTSPHLVALNERFVIGDAAVDDEALVDAIEVVRSAIDALARGGRLEVQPTFFETTTAVAFELFRRGGADVAVVEVGLGGRLDATNVLTPMVSAVTSIGFEHQQYLGDTLAKIAAEKAGIIKPGVPVVVGEMPAEALETIAGIARARGADLVRAGAAVPPEYAGLPLGLRGAHQMKNAAVAVGLLELSRTRGLDVPAAAIAAGLTDVRWPGRLDLRRFEDGRTLLLDAAHNADGAAALAAYLADERRHPTLVFAAMRDKNVTAMLRTLAPHVDALIATRASNPRSADPADIAETARTVAPGLPVLVEASPREAVLAAFRRSPYVVVAGSLFLLGDVLADRGIWS